MTLPRRKTLPLALLLASLLWSSPTCAPRRPRSAAPARTPASRRTAPGRPACAGRAGAVARTERAGRVGRAPGHSPAVVCRAPRNTSRPGPVAPPPTQPTPQPATTQPTTQPVAPAAASTEPAAPGTPPSPLPPTAATTEPATLPTTRLTGPGTTPATGPATLASTEPAAGAGPATRPGAAERPSGHGAGASRHASRARRRCDSGASRVPPAPARRRHVAPRVHRHRRELGPDGRDRSATDVPGRRNRRPPPPGRCPAGGPADPFARRAARLLSPPRPQRHPQPRAGAGSALSDVPPRKPLVPL